MPLNHGYTSKDGDRVGYYQWGSEGKKYTYQPGNDKDRNKAKEKAKRQGRAIEASKH